MVGCILICKDCGGSNGRTPTPRSTYKSPYFQENQEPYILQINLTLSNCIFQAGRPYCSACYADKFAARCKGCLKPITDKAIIALDAKWHRDCFTCMVSVSDTFVKLAEKSTASLWYRIPHWRYKYLYSLNLVVPSLCDCAWGFYVCNMMNDFTHDAGFIPNVGKV